jgi:hypothetical protein
MTIKLSCQNHHLQVSNSSVLPVSTNICFFAECEYFCIKAKIVHILTSVGILQLNVLIFEELVVF